MIGTPWSLLLFNRATQEASGSAVRTRLLNKAFGIQIIAIIGTYWTYKSTIGALDKYSAKYLSQLDDAAILSFEKQDPKSINLSANNIS
jgi:hypothetical protein